MKKARLALVVALLVLGGATARAADIYLDPALRIVGGPTTVSFDLYMDFAESEATLGGGIDIDLSGPVEWVSFAPSSYFNGTPVPPNTTAPDADFTGHGTAQADNDYEIHFGNFGGLSGRNLLGTITVNYLGNDTAYLDLSANSFYGGFFGVNSQPQNVTFSGAVIAIPEPASLALWSLGLLAVAARRRGLALAGGRS